MTDIPDIDFGEEDESPIYLGRANLSLDGSVFAEVYSVDPDPFIGTGRKLDLRELHEIVGYEETDDVDEFVQEVINPYDGRALNKNSRVYYGYNALRAKLDGMRGIWHYIREGGIFYDKSDDDTYEDGDFEPDDDYKSDTYEYIVYIRS